MFKNLVDPQSLNFLLVFLEGLLSFFSPCVIPLIPVYISYLAGNGKQKNPDGSVTYDRKQVFLHTVCFVIGISITFFILGFSAYKLGSFFQSNKTVFSRVGGILIVLLGLIQVGFLDIPFLKKELKFRLKPNPTKMNPLVALAMGFTFSFAWTPCIGPLLSSVLLLVSTAQSPMVGTMLIVVYSLGFVIPFLLLGLFTSQVLNFLKARRNLLKYTIKIGGVILILVGIMTFTGWFNGISSYLNTLTAKAPQATQTQETAPPAAAPEVAPAPESVPKTVPDPEKEPVLIPAPDFTLLDQFGNEHKLSDYKGKVVFLNFWTTWCGYCKTEMPYIEELYAEYGLNEKDVVILGVANPKDSEHLYNADETQDVVEAFITDMKLTFPVVFDKTSDVFQSFYVESFPTTYLIDKDGNLFGSVSGAMTKDMMKSTIEQTLSGKRA